MSKKIKKIKTKAKKIASDIIDKGLKQGYKSKKEKAVLEEIKDKIDVDETKIIPHKIYTEQELNSMTTAELLEIADNCNIPVARDTLIREILRLQGLR